MYAKIGIVQENRPINMRIYFITLPTDNELSALLVKAFSNYLLRLSRMLLSFLITT